MKRTPPMPSLKAEELAQWLQEVHGTKAYPTASHEVLQPPVRQPSAARQRQLLGAAPLIPPHAKPELKSHLPPLSAGSFAGVDAASRRKIKRGQMPIDSQIDLHGLTQTEAFNVLRQHISLAFVSQQRLLLVITGKGSLKGGALRLALPLWLNDAAIRPYVLAFDWARSEDGGRGAAYVLLKKQVMSPHAIDSGRR